MKEEKQGLPISATVVHSRKGQGMTGTTKATWLFKQPEFIDKGEQNKEHGSKQQIGTYNIHTTISRGSPNSLYRGRSDNCPGPRQSVLSSVRLPIVLCLWLPFILRFLTQGFRHLDNLSYFFLFSWMGCFYSPVRCPLGCPAHTRSMTQDIFLLTCALGSGLKWPSPALSPDTFLHVGPRSQCPRKANELCTPFPCKHPYLCLSPLPTSQSDGRTQPSLCSITHLLCACTWAAKHGWRKSHCADESQFKSVTSNLKWAANTVS